MRRFRLPLLAVALAALASPAPAGVFFNKHPKPNPAERVPELLATAKSDPDEHKRSSAVEELRQYDPTAFPDMVPVLLEVLAKDPKPGVRADAAETLGKLRPVSQQVGRALEQALAQDSSMRVRLQARYALLGYHWAGYHSAKKSDGPLPPTNEPPAAAATAPSTSAAPPVINTTTPGTPRLTPVPAVKVLPQPPPARPVPTAPSARPLPTPTAPPPLAPVDPPALKMPPTPPKDDGPALTPP
jgi:hypothetical protein